MVNLGMLGMGHLRANRRETAGGVQIIFVFLFYLKSFHISDIRLSLTITMLTTCI